MFYEILDQKRLEILPLFSFLKGRFYLAGGTALALQFGHRDSIDFDFFSPDSIDTQALFSELHERFLGHELLRTQETKNTLSILIDGNIRCSFFTYPYPLLKTFLDEPYLKIAAPEDIAAMKLSAITSRASNKDYIDLYYLLKKIPLSTMIENAFHKLPDLDTNLILKSLVFFDDIQEEPILFKKGFEVDFGKVKDTLVQAVQKGKWR